MDLNDANTLPCPGCDKITTGIHCVHCGEVVRPKRFTLANILKSIPDIFFDLEQGLFYSIWMLMKKPGDTVRRYLAGDRIRHYKPLKFVLFLGGLYAFLFVTFDIQGVSKGLFEGLLKDASTGKDTGRRMDLFTEQWTSVFLLIQFPVISLFTWLIFKKRNYNYGEHLMANAFFIGEVSLYNILLFPVFYLLNHTKWVDHLYSLYSLWILFYYTYAFYDWLYYRKTSRGFFICLILVFCLLLFIGLLSIILAIILFIIKLKFGGSNQ